MPTDLLRFRLTDAQRAQVASEAGVELDEVVYPDPGGELTAAFDALDPDDVVLLATAKATVEAYERDRAAAVAALDASEADANAEAARARAEIDALTREAEERRAQMVEEASQGRRAKRKPAKRPSQTAGDSDEP